MTVNDDLRRLRAADPLTNRPSGSPPEELLATIRQRITGSPALDRPRRRRGPIMLGAAVLVGTATVANANWDGQESTVISCVTDQGVWAVGAVTSDPVADCVARLALDGVAIEPGQLSTFRTGDGEVVVTPDAASAEGVVTGDLVPAPDLRLAEAPIELRLALDDLVIGVARCSDPAGAATRAGAIAARLGFPHWEVVERERPSGTDCAWAFADLDAQQIVVGFDAPRSGVDRSTGAVVRGPDGEPTPVPEEYVTRVEPERDGARTEAELRTLSRQIHDVVGGACLTAAEAETAALHAVAGTSQADTSRIVVSEDADADCARVYTNAYGSYQVTILGP